MLIHIFNDDETISIMIDSDIIIIEKNHKNYDKIVENLKLRNWDYVVALVKNQ